MLYRFCTFVRTNTDTYKHKQSGLVITMICSLVEAAGVTWCTMDDKR